MVRGRDVREGVGGKRGGKGGRKEKGRTGDKERSEGGGE